MGLLAGIEVGDSADAWVGLGFDVSDGRTLVDGVAHTFGGAGRGITGWTLWGVELAPGATDLDGLPTMVTTGEPPMPCTPEHPNGVVGLDHVVVFTPDLPRSIAAFETAGLALRRTRDSGAYGAPMRQAFFRLGPVVLEVVGSAETVAEGPARFFGLAWTCADLDATARWLGDVLHPPKDAVQAGRRIATLDRSAGTKVAMAFMSGQPD